MPYISSYFFFLPSLTTSPETLNSIAKSLVSAAQALSTQLGSLYELLQAADLSSHSGFVGDSCQAFEECVVVTRPLDVKMFSKMTKIALKFILQHRVILHELDRLVSFTEFYLDK